MTTFRGFPLENENVTRKHPDWIFDLRVKHFENELINPF